MKTGLMIVSAIAGVLLVNHGVKVFASERSPYGKYSHVKVLVPGIALIVVPTIIYMNKKIV